MIWQSVARWVTDFIEHRIKDIAKVKEHFIVILWSIIYRLQIMYDLTFTLVLVLKGSKRSRKGLFLNPGQCKSVSLPWSNNNSWSHLSDADSDKHGFSMV